MLQMANIVNLVISFFALVLLWPKSLAIDTEDVKNMADELSSLTSATYDIIQTLRFTSKHAVTFISVAGPVGAIIATAVNISLRPESEELKAIKELHDFVKQKFEDLQEDIHKKRLAITDFLFEQDYRESVTMSLDVIEPSYKDITDPLEDRSIFKERFTDLCKDTHTSPYYVLIRMKRRLVTDCDMPSQEQTVSYAAVLELFQKIEQRHLQKITIPMEEYKLIKSSLLAKSAREHLQIKLNKILHIKDSAEVGQALIKLNSRLPNGNPSCWLQIIADGNEWKRDPLFHFAQIVRLDLMKASLMASHCADFSYVSEKEEHLNKIKLLLQEIATHLADWISEILKLTWPKISRNHAITAIGNSPIKEDKDAYQSVAETIKSELNTIGSDKYSYTVIVFPNWADPEAKQFICESDSCFDLFDVSKINVIVARVEDNQTNFDTSCKAIDWFTPTIESKMKEIIKLWWDHKTYSKLIDLAKSLQANLQFYRNLVLIHNWKFRSSAAIITLGVTETYIKSSRAEQSFYYKINPMFSDAEIFYVHMIV